MIISCFEDIIYISLTLSEPPPPPLRSIKAKFRDFSMCPVELLQGLCFRERFRYIFLTNTHFPPALPFDRKLHCL